MTGKTHLKVMQEQRTDRERLACSSKAIGVRNWRSTSMRDGVAGIARQTHSRKARRDTKQGFGASERVP